MFDDLTPDELTSAHATITNTGIHAARLIAADRLASGPAEGLGTPETLVELLQQRDTTDPRWERLQPFEQRWSLLVVRLLDAVSKDLSQAVADARNRGATWAAIADTLGVKTPSAYQRFRHQV